MNSDLSLPKTNRDLDLEVGEKVFGVPKDARRFRTRYGYEIVPGATWSGRWVDVPPFSSNIDAAWEVVGRLQADDMQLTLRSRDRGTEAEFIRGILSRGVEYADTAPLAICRAALKAVE